MLLILLIPRLFVTPPASTTHAQMSEEENSRWGKTEAIRMSVGLEDVEDLIADLKQAFAKI